MLGTREPEVYGSVTLPEIVKTVTSLAADRGFETKAFQSNHEGALIDFIQTEQSGASGIIINPGALTHYALALRDCLAAVNLPKVEVHISNVHKREEWRRRSVLTEVCDGVIGGLGVKGYELALEYICDKAGSGK
jgi:3-dehydroquinate dehydratase-2